MLPWSSFVEEEVLKNKQGSGDELCEKTNAGIWKTKLAVKQDFTTNMCFNAQKSVEHLNDEILIRKRC